MLWAKDIIFTVIIYYYDSPNKIYTINEIEEMFAEKEEKANVTRIIKSGKDALWHKIKIGN